MAPSELCLLTGQTDLALSPFSDRLRKVIDQRVTSMGAMLCSQSWRASPVR